MKSVVKTVARQFTRTSGEHSSESVGEGRDAEEPPGAAGACNDLKKEPPSKRYSSRDAIFGHVAPGLWDDWKWQFRNRITNTDRLASLLGLSSREQKEIRLVALRYPVSVTPYYLSLIDLNDPEDPVRRQAVPSILEISLATEGYEDPLDERKDTVVPGLVHRYPDRVLMVLTDICGVFCRHCTRKREWQAGGWVRTQAQIEAMLDYIRQHEVIRDVIISGGDPLTLSTTRLEDIISRLRAIRHVEIIRIDSRLPVVLPQRVDAELCDMLSNYGPIWLNTQFNHPREVTPESAQACDRLLRCGVPVNNQSVLLRGINDSVAVQTKLCQELLRIKVRPYYLFQGDEVQGTEHLRTPVGLGIKIIEGMRGHTSGMAVPTFVIDLPHSGGKIPLQPEYVLMQSEEELLLRNYQGHLFRYRNPKRQVCAQPFGAAVRAGDNGHRSQIAQHELQLEPEGVADADRVVVRS